jgi:hypothetical protein
MPGPPSTSPIKAAENLYCPEEETTNGGWLVSLVRSCGPKPVKSTVFPPEITAGPEVTAKKHASPDVEVAARVSGAIDVGEGT